MNKRMWFVVGTFAVVAVLGLTVIGSASAAQPPSNGSTWECPLDCPYDGQPQGRWNQGMQDWEPGQGMMGRGNQATQDWEPGQGMMGRGSQGAQDWEPGQGMMGRANQGSTSGGAWMGRWNQDDNAAAGQGGRWQPGSGRQDMPCENGGMFGRGMMGRGNQGTQGWEPGQGMLGRGFDDDGSSAGRGNGRGMM